MSVTLPVVGAQLAVNKVTFKINYYQQAGWTETYWIPQGTLSGTPSNPFTNSPAQAKAGAILRSYMLGLGCSIVSVTVTNPAQPRLSVQALTSPLSALLIDAESTVEAINDPQVTMMYRSDDAYGHHEERHFRGLRDSWVTNDLLSGTPNSGGVSAVGTTGTLPGTVPLGSAPAGNVAVLNFLYWMQSYCVMRGAKSGNPPTWVTYPMYSIQYRDISSRKVGRPFGLPRGRALTKV